MSHSKVHSQGNVPFSWENEPGVSKVRYQERVTDAAGNDGYFAVKLPPPPCPPEKARRSPVVHDLQVPLPPCPFQPTSRSFSKKGLKKEDDPFLTAYKECTKSTKKGKSMFNFSCKQYSCSVRDDNLVKMSQLSISISERRRRRERERGGDN